MRDQLRKRYPQFDLKLILSGYRGGSIKRVWEELKDTVALRKKWNQQNFVIGFDLVGEEDGGRPTAFYLSDWSKLKSYLAETKATLPLYFHDGESDWSSDDNLYDAYLLGAKRIGHGFNLFRFPVLEKQLKQQQFALEICPISNQILGFVRDLRVHPANGYLSRGVPCVLSNDDPGILGNDGLSFDFWEATVAWELDLRAIKQLAMNSLKYSGMTQKEKQRAITHWQTQWAGWVQQTSKNLNN